MGIAPEDSGFDISVILLTLYRLSTEHAQITTPSQQRIKSSRFLKDDWRVCALIRSHRCWWLLSIWSLSVWSLLLTILLFFFCNSQLKRWLVSCMWCTETAMGMDMACRSTFSKSPTNSSHSDCWTADLQFAFDVDWVTTNMDRWLDPQVCQLDFNGCVCRL